MINPMSDLGIQYNSEKLKESFSYLIENADTLKKSSGGKIDSSVLNVNIFSLTSVNEHDIYDSGSFEDARIRNRMNHTPTEEDFTVPTSLYSGYFKEVLDDMRERIGENINRVRINHSSTGGLPTHKDFDEKGLYRYVIPIIVPRHFSFFVGMTDTPPYVFREYSELQEGQVYCFDATLPHSTMNWTTTYRATLIFSSKGKL